MQGAWLDLPAVCLGRHHCGYTPWQQDAQQCGGLLRIHSHASTCVKFCICLAKLCQQPKQSIAKMYTIANESKVHPLTWMPIAEQEWTRWDVMLPWFALVGHTWPTGLGIWKQCNARSMTRLACSLSRTPPLWIYTMTTRCPTVWWAAENTQPCVHMCQVLRLSCQALPATQAKHSKDVHNTQWIQSSSTDMNAHCWTRMNKMGRDASMVCPCWPHMTHRARNMEAVQCKEHDSTCLQFV